MKRHSEEKLSTEPEVGVVIAKTTMQPIRLILHKNQIRKTKTGPNSDFYHPPPHSNKLQYIPAVSYTVVPLNQHQKTEDSGNYGFNSVFKCKSPSSLEDSLKIRWFKSHYIKCHGVSLLLHFFFPLKNLFIYLMWYKLHVELSDLLFILRSINFYNCWFLMLNKHQNYNQTPPTTQRHPTVIQVHTTLKI